MVCDGGIMGFVLYQWSILHHSVELQAHQHLLQASFTPENDQSPKLFQRGVESKGTLRSRVRHGSASGCERGYMDDGESCVASDCGPLEEAEG